MQPHEFLNLCLWSIPPGYNLAYLINFFPHRHPPCTMSDPLPVTNTLKPVESISDLSRLSWPPQWPMRSVIELELLAGIANDIFGTGQVFSAGGNLTPPNGTAEGEERVWSDQTCWCFTGGCVSVPVYHYTSGSMWKTGIKNKQGLYELL